MSQSPPKHPWLAADHPDGKLFLGFHFQPKDLIIITVFLLYKILGMALPRHEIEEIDVYSRRPDSLHFKFAGVRTDTVSGKTVSDYFFSFCAGMGLGGRRETPGGGYWEAHRGGEKSVVGDGGTVVGYWRKFVFYEADGGKTGFRVIEYTINRAAFDELKDNSEMKDLVVCKIYKITGPSVYPSSVDPNIDPYLSDEEYMEG